MSRPRSTGNASNAADERSPLIGRISSDHAGTLESGIDGSSSHLGAGIQDVEAEPPGQVRNAEGLPQIRKQMKYIMPALAIGVFLTAADQTIIVSSYGKIGSELNALQSTSWIATAYFLTLTSFQPLYGKLSDIFGRKEALLSAYAFFGLGCLLCGLSTRIEHLIAARACQGLGGGMTTVVSILLSDIVTLRERGTFQGYMNIVWAGGAGIGAPLGGYLADSIGWRWSFLGQAPITLVAIITVYLTLNLPAREASNWKDKLRRIDFLGAFTLVMGVFALLLSLDRGSNVSWAQPLTLALLATSVALLLAFLYVEMRVASEPFAPGHIIFDRSLCASYLCNFFSFAGWMAAIFYIPLYFQAVDGLSATQAGAKLIPAIGAGVCGSLFAGFLMKRTGRYYRLTVVAYTGLFWGFLPIILFSGVVSKSDWGMTAGMVICGFSNGIGITSSLISLSEFKTRQSSTRLASGPIPHVSWNLKPDPVAQASSDDLAVVTACSYLFRSLGSVIGVSLSSTAVQQSLRLNLRAALQNGGDAEAIVDRVRQSLDFIKTLEPATRDIVRHCYSTATTISFVLDACIAAGAALSAVFITENKLG